MQTLFAPYASKRTCWVLLTALLLAIVAQPTLGLQEEVNSISAYEAVEEGDTISIFELVQAEEDDDAEDPGEEIHVASWSGLRSLLAKKKTDCRKPVNKKKKACRKPSTKRPSPPPPRPRPSPPPPVEDEYVYEAPDMPYDAPVTPTPMPSPPPPSVVYNQVVCDYTPRRKILSGPRMTNGGLRACTGLHVSDAGACCEVCRGTFGCNGWMYTKPLDCRVFGQPNPENVCYMLSEATGSYDPILPELEYQSGTAFY